MRLAAAQVRPHFLFNSLDAVASTITVAPERAERLVEDLADLFRATLRLERASLVPLSEELSLVEGYLRMERERLGERLSVVWRTGSLPGEALIPPLTLQPLFENAVYYGVEPRREGGTLMVTGRVVGEIVLVELVNPLPPPTARTPGFGMAQLQQRSADRPALAFGHQGVAGGQRAGRRLIRSSTVPFPDSARGRPMKIPACVTTRHRRASAWRR
ncbi:MAG: histidine kinase [Arhodomonas sp.]|nr:histidine kinase [Arhodomonas sp.]